LCWLEAAWLFSTASKDLRARPQRVTQSGGSYNFVNLPLGTYRLIISKEGFKAQAFQSVVVQAARVTDVKGRLEVGATTQTVDVTATATPVLEATSNMIGTTIDIKQIEDLPLQGRDLSQLATLTPGYNGTWNGLPSIDQGNNIDGVIGSPTGMKFSGNSQSVVSPRSEDIAEMTVQTDQLDLNQGFGQAPCNSTSSTAVDQTSFTAERLRTSRIRH
jgi:hypothetical protein